MMRWLALSVLLLVAPAEGDENSEVGYLIEWVRASGCTFIRNGNAHAAPAAADHLAMKYRRGRRWIDSAEDFISRIATKSSMSGEPYQVECPGQARRASATWLTGALRTHRGRGES